MHEVQQSVTKIKGSGCSSRKVSHKWLETLIKRAIEATKKSPSPRTITAQCYNNKTTIAYKSCYTSEEEQGLAFIEGV